MSTIGNPPRSGNTTEFDGSIENFLGKRTVTASADPDYNLWACILNRIGVGVRTRT